MCITAATATLSQFYQPWQHAGQHNGLEQLVTNKSQAYTVNSAYTGMNRLSFGFCCLLLDDRGRQTHQPAKFSNFQLQLIRVARRDL